MDRRQTIAALRQQVGRLEQDGRWRQGRKAVLPFGVPGIDGRLPGGGLALGALHEVAAAAGAPCPDAMAALFAAAILARLDGPVLWCLAARDLFAPGLACVGLHPDRVIYAEAPRAADIPALMEEGLRHVGLAGVVGETDRLDRIASRRLQLAAETSGVTAFVIGRGGNVPKAREPTAATTRWQIAALPSASMPVPGIGRARWRLDLVRCRGGEPAQWLVEGPDEEGRLALPAALADRPAAPAEGPVRPDAAA